MPPQVLPTSGSAATSGEAVKPPPGWTDFCKKNPVECKATNGNRELQGILLTPATWKVIQEVNHLVNRTIKPVSDMRHWGVVERWSIPKDGKGDCEDSALLKKQILIRQHKMPEEAILLTVVRLKNDDLHVGLTVKTDRGELFLDSDRPEILPVEKTGYPLVKRQSEKDPKKWVNIVGFIKVGGTDNQTSGTSTQQPSALHPDAAQNRQGQPKLRRPSAAPGRAAGTPRP